MKIHSVLLGLSLAIVQPSTHACEPASLNWQALYQQNDLNKDGFINHTEWQMVSQLKEQSYQWQKPTTANDPFRFEIFKLLDKNQDQQLNEDELSDIYLYLPNPCANFNNRPQQQSTSMWQRFLNLF